MYILCVIVGKKFSSKPLMWEGRDDDLPDLDHVKAYYFDGSSGFAMHRGTWHEFPFAIDFT